jgi:hypothetical protein
MGQRSRSNANSLAESALVASLEFVPVDGVGEEGEEDEESETPHNTPPHDPDLPLLTIEESLF